MEYFKLREIQWKSKKQKISQIYSQGLEYAFVSSDYQQIHQLVWCKDFMQDAVYGYLNNKKVSIYGFVYDPKKFLPLHTDSTRLMLTNWRDKELEFKIENCLDFLHQIESCLKMKQTVVEKCLGAPKRYQKSGVWLFEGSRRWMKSPPMISLYTLFIRLGFVHDQGNSYKKTIYQVIKTEKKAYQRNDAHYLKSSMNAIKWIMEYGDRKIFFRSIKDNYPRKVSLSVIHNNCGVVSFARENTKPYFPHWHRLQNTKQKEA
jgi:hypothetical protein